MKSVNLPILNSPLDARSLVAEHSLLIDASYWLNKNGDDISYEGMIVTVTSDSETEKNGVYYLQQLPTTDVASWVKVGTDVSGLDYDVLGEW